MSLRQKAPFLLVLLLPAAGGVLSAQDDRFEPRHESADAGHVAEPHNEPASSPEPPPEPPPEPSSAPPEAPPETPSVSPPEAPPESPTDTPSPPGRYAVPVTEPVEPHRQPPSRDRQPPSGGDGDGDGSTVPEDPPVEAYETDDSYESLWTWGSYLFGRGSDRRDFLGALDLDVSPGRTQIYLEGQYLGIVDQYDGWPSYLVLEQGTYELVFYLDGYRTLVRRVTVVPRTKFKVEDRLEPGPSVRPEELMSRMYKGR